MAMYHRVGFTAAQSAELWERWKKGEGLKSIGRAFGKPSSCIFAHLRPSGGIMPPARRRSRLALTMAEREEISRGIVEGQSVRAIARVTCTCQSRYVDNPYCLFEWWRSGRDGPSGQPQQAKQQNHRCCGRRSIGSKRLGLLHELVPSTGRNWPCIANLHGFGVAPSRISCVLSNESLHFTGFCADFRDVDGKCAVGSIGKGSVR
jgi:Helix-turn-helix domain